MLNRLLSFFGRVWCDRGHHVVKGYIGDRMSAGVYVDWAEYTNPGEHVICDACMWSDERFLAVYPYMRGQR